MRVGEEWIRYQEMNVREDDQSLLVDHFWKRKITVEISLKCGQKWSNEL